MIRIMVVDDHDLYREVLADFLTRNGFMVIHALRSDQLLEDILRPDHLPDIAIISFKTSKSNNLTSLHWLRGQYPLVKILITTLFNDKIPLEDLKGIGIEGVIIKSHADTQQIVKALQAIHAGQTFY